jgi:uncharacterized protein YigE (DUF2233 family)
MQEETVEATQEAQISQDDAQKQQGQAPDLNLNDLAALRSILDVASQRGTFKAAELESVGKVYNKLNNFLEAVAKKEQQ